MYTKNTYKSISVDLFFFFFPRRSVVILKGLSFTVNDLYVFNLAEPASPKKRPLEEMEEEEPAPKQLKTENGAGDQ